MNNVILEQLTWRDIKDIVEMTENVNLPILDKPFATEEEIYSRVLEQLREKAGVTTKKNGPEGYVGAFLQSFRDLGYKPKWNPENRSVTFYYFGNKVTFFPKKQYFNGKGLRPGFGIDNLLYQLKENPMPNVKKNG